MVLWSSAPWVWKINTWCISLYTVFVGVSCPCRVCVWVFLCLWYLEEKSMFLHVWKSIGTQPGKQCERDNLGVTETSHNSKETLYFNPGALKWMRISGTKKLWVLRNWLSICCTSPKTDKQTVSYVVFFFSRKMISGHAR